MQDTPVYGYGIGAGFGMAYKNIKEGGMR